MDFEEFKKEIVDHIKDFLPERFKDANVDIREVPKNNEVLTGVSVVLPDVNISPTVYVDKLFEHFNDDGMSLDSVLSELATVIVDHFPEHDFDVSKIMDLDSIKDRIFPRLFGVENNEQLLSERPHIPKAEDLAISYCIELSKGDIECASVPITNQMLNQYGIDLNELNDIAMKNMSEKMDITVDGLFDIVKSMIMEKMNVAGEEPDFIDQMISDMADGEAGMLVVSNKEKAFGAIAIFDDNTMNEMAEKLGGDFIVLPSSLHECIVLPMGEELDKQRFEDMVREVNANEVPAQDRLSNSVYVYDSKEKELLRADVYENRLAERDNQKSNDKDNEKKSFKEQLKESKEEVKNQPVKDKSKQHDKNRNASL